MEAVSTVFRARLVPELIVSNIAASLAFWCDLLGFSVLYDRSEEKFAYLDLDGAQVMLEQRSQLERQWITGPLKQPFGRGINFQIETADISLPIAKLHSASWPLYMDAEEKWFCTDKSERGVRQFIVQDPDGYLIRMSSALGERPVEIARTEN